MTVTPTFYLVVGLPSSGKSRLARKQKALCVSKDAIVKMATGGYNPKFEGAYRVIQKSAIDDLLRVGYDVVIDKNNITVEARRKWVRMGKYHECKIVALVLKTPVEKCIEFDRKRGGLAGEKSIKKASDLIEWPTLDEGFDEVIIIE